MITKLTVEFFKTLERVEIELGLVNVFVGANGSGKSNLLEAVGVLSAVQVSVLTIDTKARPAEFVERFGETQWAACSSWGILISTLRKCQ